MLISGSGVPGRDGWVRSNQVMPGRDGTELPFGSVTSTGFWTVQGWADSGDENVDYGAIVVPNPVGDTVGTFGFGVFTDDELAGSTVNVAGYPGDKPAGTAWFDSRQVASTGPSKVRYDIDTAGGQSGARSTGSTATSGSTGTSGSRSPCTPTAAPPRTPAPASRRRCSAT